MDKMDGWARDVGPLPIPPTITYTRQPLLTQSSLITDHERLFPCHASFSHVLPIAEATNPILRIGLN